MYNYLYYIVLNIVLYYYLYRNLIDLLQLLDLYLCLWNSKFQFKVFTYVHMSHTGCYRVYSNYPLKLNYPHTGYHLVEYTLYSIA